MILNNKEVLNDHENHYWLYVLASLTRKIFSFKFLYVKYKEICKCLQDQD